MTPPKSLPMDGQPSQITIPKPMAATATTAALRRPARRKRCATAGQDQPGTGVREKVTLPNPYQRSPKIGREFSSDPLHRPAESGVDGERGHSERSSGDGGRDAVRSAPTAAPRRSRSQPSPASRDSLRSRAVAALPGHRAGQHHGCRPHRRQGQDQPGDRQATHDDPGDHDQHEHRADECRRPDTRSERRPRGRRIEASRLRSPRC